MITDETVLRAHRATLGLGDGGYWLSYPIKAFDRTSIVSEIVDVTVPFSATSRENVIEICRRILIFIRPVIIVRGW